jgi:hypothetical protein
MNHVLRDLLYIHVSPLSGFFRAGEEGIPGAPKMEGGIWSRGDRDDGGGGTRRQGRSKERKRPAELVFLNFKGAQESILPAYIA